MMHFASLLASRLAILPLIAGLSAGCTLHWDDSDDGDPPYVFSPDAGPAPGWIDAQPWPSGPDGGQRPVDAGPVPVPDSGVPFPPDAGDRFPPDAGDPFPPDAGDRFPPDAGTGIDCSLISVEAVCVVTAGCTPLYEGVDCRCYGDGTCECDSWVFDRCD